MGKIQTIIVIAGLLFSLTASAENKQTPEVTNKIERYREIWKFS